jgi:S1-C subfamily serine protease
LDSAGQLIGMNTMIVSKSGFSAGIGFAVPVSTIARVVPQIIRTGRAEQVGIGVSVDPDRKLEQRVAARYGRPFPGLIVLGVGPNTPAAKAGLRPAVRGPDGIRIHDVIVGIDQKPVNDYDDLYTILDERKPGEKVSVKVQRGDTTVALDMELVRLEPKATP